MDTCPLLVHSKPIGAALLFVGIQFAITSTANEYWYYGGYTDRSILVSNEGRNFGLWEVCDSLTLAGRGPGCRSWGDIEDISGGVLNLSWLHACQAMMSIGVFLNAVALVYVIVAHVKKTTAKIAQVTSCIGGICYIIAAIIFGCKYKEVLFLLSYPEGGELSVWFGLAIVAAIFNLIPAWLIGQGPAPGGYQNI